MLNRTAQILTENIDEITRRWVDELRASDRTESHKHMLTSEIVSGVKAMLSNLADALRGKETPDSEPLPGDIAEDNGPTAAEARPSPTSIRTTMPLAPPLARAQQGAATHGVLRHSQGFQLYEVILEFVKLRQVIWDTLKAGQLEKSFTLTLDYPQYIDLLFDELMLTCLESYYQASVQDLETRAIRDPLTDLYNKDYFHRRLQEEIRRALRHSESLTVAMIDMDRLKVTNDTYGHPAGDAVIATIANAIRESCRQSDVPCRYGGDEFAVILPETNKEQAVVFAERLLEAVQSLEPITLTSAATPKPGEIDLSGGDDLSKADGEKAKTGAALTVPVPSVSIGLSSFPEDGRNPEVLLGRADAALYRAKGAGRNRMSH